CGGHFGSTRRKPRAATGLPRGMASTSAGRAPRGTLAETPFEPVGSPPGTSSMARIRFAALVALTGVLPFTLLAFTLPAPRAPGRPLIPDGIYDGIATAQTLAYWRSKLALDVDEALMRH